MVKIVVCSSTILHSKVQFEIPFVSNYTASFSLYLVTCPYLFWHFVQLLQTLPYLSRTRSDVPRMQKSRSPVLRTQRCPRYSLLNLTQPQWRLACFIWCQELCLLILSFFLFIFFFSFFLSFRRSFNSHSQLNIKWHASRALDQFILVTQWGTVDAEINVSSTENPEQTNVFSLKALGRLEYIATHASSVAKNVFLILIFNFPVPSSPFSFFKILSLHFLFVFVFVLFFAVLVQCVSESLFNLTLTFQCPDIAILVDWA